MRNATFGLVLLCVISAGRVGTAGFVAIDSGSVATTSFGAGGLTVTSTANIAVIGSMTPSGSGTSLTIFDATINYSLGAPVSGSFATGFGFGSGGSYALTGRLTSSGPIVTLASATLRAGYLLNPFDAGGTTEYALFFGTPETFTLNSAVASKYGISTIATGNLGATFVQTP